MLSDQRLIVQEQGPEAIRDKIGVEPTGLPFNSKMAIELYDARSVNPLVNAGAIAQVSLVEQQQMLEALTDERSGSCAPVSRPLPSRWRSLPGSPSLPS
jgi:glutaminase